MMKRLFVLTIVLALSSAMAAVASATLAFYEGFEYAAGDLLGNTNPFTGTDWSDVTDTVVSPGATYPGLTVSGNAAIGESGGTASLDGLTQVQTLFAQESGTVYLTGMISGEASRAWYRCTGAGCTGDQSLWFQSFGGNVAIGIHGIGGEATPTLGAQVPPNGTQINLIALKVDFAVGNDTVSGILNPDLSMGEPTFTFLSAGFDLNGGDWTSFHLNSDAGVINDEFRVATTWDEVIIGGTPGPAPTSFTWQADGLGDWTLPGSWAPAGGPPNSSGHTAVFGGLITKTTTPVTNSAVTVNALQFNNSNHSYAIAGQGSVNLEISTGSNPKLPTIGVLAGSHQFQANVNLLSNTTADVASGSTLSFNNELNLMGQTLTKTGGGTLAINNELTTAGGTVNILQGTVSGVGTIGGDVINDGGTISPGSSSSATAVPEPAGLVLLLVGAIGLGLRRRWTAPSEKSHCSSQQPQST